MIKISGKHQVSIFGEFSDIVPTSETILSILNSFKGKDFIPGTVREIAKIGTGNEIRLQLATQNKEWLVNFLTNRIDIEKNPIEGDGDNIGNIQNFVEEAVDICKRIIKAFKIKSYRLSLITTGMLDDMNSSKLDAIYIKLFNPISYYRKNIPFEWNFRTGANTEITIKNKKERLNVLTSLNRIHGLIIHQDVTQNFDRIEIQFDINTTHENKNQRFNINSIIEFLNQAIEIRTQLITDIKEHINV